MPNNTLAASGSACSVFALLEQCGLHTGLLAAAQSRPNHEPPGALQGERGVKRADVHEGPVSREGAS